MSCVYLKAGHSGWQHQPPVVSVHHGEDADGPGGKAPGVLEGQLLLARLLRVFEHDLEHSRKVLTEMVGCRALQQVANTKLASQFN